MLVRYTVLLMVAAGAFSAPATAAARTTLNRREIRQMPILERPSRPGHFYGNAVRRSSGRQAGPMGPNLTP